MKMLTAIVLITTLSACSATETVACPPKDQFVEPGSGPFVCGDVFPVDPASRKQTRFGPIQD